MIRERIRQAQERRDETAKRRGALAGRLRAFGQVLPSSSGDLELLRAALAEQSAGLGERLTQLSREYETQAAEKGRLSGALAELAAELERVSKRAGNIPAEADLRRRLIAEGVMIPVERLPYIGELLDIPAEHRGWERAILTIIRPLASDLLVPADDFPAVRAWVNSHNLRGDITLVPGVADLQARDHPAGTVAAMLEVEAGPYRGWVSRELERFAYLCVEKDTDLDGPRPDRVVGRLTRAGLRADLEDTTPRCRPATAMRPGSWSSRSRSTTRPGKITSVP